MSNFQNIVFIDPWRPAQHEEERENLQRQLRKELSEQHPLWNKGCEVIGCSDINDNILTVCAGGRFAIVHLTWGQGPGDAKYPRTLVYDTVQALNDGIWADAVWRGFVEDFDPNDARLQIGR